MNKNIIVNKSIIAENKKISKDTFLLKFKSKQKFFPTQFVMVDTEPVRFLLKPFTIAEYDTEKNLVSIIYRVVGEGTKFLSQKNVGQEIKFIGPFGNVEKFKKVIRDLEKLKCREKLKKVNENKIVLLAGGSGIASIMYLHKWLLKKIGYIKTFYGESDKSFVINLKKFGIDNVAYTTDNGSFGKKGFVTDVFDKEIQNSKFKIQKENNKNNLQLTNSQAQTTIFACGPKPMLKSLQDIVNENKNFKCYALLEEYMCCGVGVCRGCVIRIKDKKDNMRGKTERFIYKTVCKDGPMFDINEIMF